MFQFITGFKIKKRKKTKIANSEIYSKRKTNSQMLKSKAQTHETYDNNCHIPDLVQAFSYVVNG